MLLTKLLNSLAKVFPDQEPQDFRHGRGSMLANEQYSFQLAYFTPARIKDDVFLEIQSPLQDCLEIYTVGLVPVELPIRFPHDENIVRTSPGLYPDVLKPLDTNERIPILPQQWRSIWITITNPIAFRGQTNSLNLTLKNQRGEVLANEDFYIEILDLELPTQNLIHTEWLHTDCLASYYDTEVFSDKYWDLVEAYISHGVKHGINMLLTPLFTPPLDTLVGGERPTVQLVDVYRTEIGYQFDFKKLKRWIDLGEKLGVRYFEFTHLFTQWGAKHAPKIMATVDGKVRQIFGWSTQATGGDYKQFLDQFLPQLVDFIKKEGLEKRVFFHVSDEPRLEDMTNYKKAKAMIEEHLEDFPLIDTLSNYEFYQMGVVKNPIVATDQVEPFLENGVSDLWVYYCSAQKLHVSQRFLSMPSARNRILGLQLYKFEIAGFLHWGYNFYYSQFSQNILDPFRETDGGHWVPAGDTFIVYPGPNGPWSSLRLKVFLEGLQDLRALELLESYLGRSTVLNLLENNLQEPLSFSKYPTDSEWLLNFREKINQKLKSLS